MIEVGTNPSTIDINAGTIDGTVIGGSTAAAVTGTTITGTSFVSSGNMTFGDSDKAIFGAGADLEIFSDGTNGRISLNAAAGDLRILADEFQLANTGYTNFYLTTTADDAVRLFHGGSQKFETTATGIDVTGGVTATSLKATDNINIQADDAQLYLTNAANTDYFLIKRTGASGDLAFDHFNGSTVSERLRITSAGNVGIGTSGPSRPLEIYQATASATALRLNGVGSYHGIQLAVAGTDQAYMSADASGLYIGHTSKINFRTGGGTSVGGTDRVTIDASGNVGIGTSSPSAPLNVYNALNPYTKFEDAANYLTVGVVTSNYGAINSSLPISFQISDVERARIDASGRVGIGTSSPTQLLSLSSSSDPFINIQHSSSGVGNKAGLSFTMSSVAGASGAKIETERLGANAQSSLSFFTGNSAGTLVRAITIDQSQRVGIGTSSPASKLNVVSGTNDGITVNDGTVNTILFNTTSANGSVGTTTNHPMAFYTNNTERARIDTSGNLLVGTTSTTNSLRFACNNTAFTRKWGFGTLGSNTAYYVVDDTTGAGVQVTAGATAWSSFSDERNKTQLKPFENAVEKVCTLRTGTGRYLTDAESVSRSFLIAQDVQKVLPEAVDVSEDEQGTLALRYTDVIPLLVAAIQEQQEQINELKAEVAALKGN